MSCVPLFLSVFQENRSGPRAAPTILFYGFSQEGPLWCSSCGPQSINLIIGCAASFGNIIGAHHKMVLLAYNQVTGSHRIVDRHFFKPVRHGISVRIKKADVISARARGICNYKCHSLGICGKSIRILCPGSLSYSGSVSPYSQYSHKAEQYGHSKTGPPLPA